MQTDLPQRTGPASAILDGVAQLGDQGLALPLKRCANADTIGGKLPQ